MGRMTLDTLKELVRKAMRYADNSVIFAFQGGEPSLAGVQFYRELVEYQRMYNARGLKIQNAVQTNGLELSNELVELFAKENFLVGVSFDGLPLLHDKLRTDAAGLATAERVENTIKKLEKYNVQFNILCVVNRYVAEHAEECFEYLKKYTYIQYIPCLEPFDGKTADWSLTPELYTAFLKKSFDMYYKSFKRGKFVSIRNFDNYLGVIAGYEPENCAMCGHCARYFLIEADGSTYPCDFYVLDQWYMGNIRDSSFYALTRSEKAEEFALPSYHVSEQCQDCKWYTLCRGGCRREREPFINGKPSLNKWCESHKTLFEYAYPRMREMSKKIFV